MEEFLSVCDARFGAVSVLDVGCGTGMFYHPKKEFIIGLNDTWGMT